VIPQALAALAGAGVLTMAPALLPVPDGGPPPPKDTGHHRHHDHPRVRPGKLVAKMRHATARFHDIAVAESAGYTQLKDVNGISCIDMPGMGGMGVHYVNPKLVADPAIDPAAPEALVYAPERDGTLRLAALEYLVDRSAWRSTHSKAPELFAGHPFDRTDSPNRFGLPTFYSQHVWVWKANPAGRLAMWNPRVNCANAPT
jgi:hypothetical protein